MTSTLETKPMTVAPSDRDKSGNAERSDMRPADDLGSRKNRPGAAAPRGGPAVVTVRCQRLTRVGARQPHPPTAQPQTYDISGSTVTTVGAGVSFATDPGSAGNASNLLLTSLDGGTLFIDGTNGILVMAAP